MPFRNRIYKVEDPKDFLDSGKIQSNPGGVCCVLGENEKVHSEFLDRIMVSVLGDKAKDIILLHPADDSVINLSLLPPENEIFIIFGIPKKDLSLNLNLQMYVPAKLGKRQFLLADSLDVIKDDQTKKRSLWTSLKEIFSIQK